MSKLFILISAIILECVSSHSWVECTNYNPPSFDHLSLGEYDRSRCSGYPRGFSRQFDAGFGIDTGYNWEHPVCTRDPFKESDYTDVVPMAKLVPGQVMYISHPSKNHVADVCTNQFIPSTSLVVKMSSEVGADTFDVSLEMLGGTHVNGQIDHLEYQRCFDFCSNQDKSHCLTGWKIPDSVSEGRHSFIWVWEFNVGQFYSNCFDAYISASSNESSLSPAPTPVSTSTSSVSTSGSESISSSNSASSDITFPVAVPTTPVPTTPVPTTPVPTTPVSTTPVPTTTESVSPSPEPTLEQDEGSSNLVESSEPAEVPENAEVISSNGNMLTSPMVDIGSYLINLIGSFNISTLMNVSRIN